MSLLDTYLFQGIPQVFIFVLVKRVQVFSHSVCKEDWVLTKERSRGHMVRHTVEHNICAGHLFT